MPKATKIEYDARVRGIGLLNIPKHLRKIHDIKQGQWVHVTLEKIHPKLTHSNVHTVTEE